MNDEDFNKLVESVNQMGAIIRGDKIAHRRTTLSKIDVRSLRGRLSLTLGNIATRQHNTTQRGLLKGANDGKPNFARTTKQKNLLRLTECVLHEGPCRKGYGVKVAVLGLRRDWREQFEATAEIALPPLSRVDGLAGCLPLSQARVAATGGFRTETRVFGEVVPTASVEHQCVELGK